MSCTDTTFTSGGIGFSAFPGTGQSVYFDYVKEESALSDDMVIEDFEDGDLAEYMFSHGASVTDIVSDPVYSGAGTLRITNDASLVRVGNLQYTPQVGEGIVSHVRVTGTPIAMFHYFAQDTNNHYSVRLDFQDDTLMLYKMENGNWTVLARNYLSFSLRHDTWYEIIVECKSNNEHIISLDGNGDLASLTCIDLTWDQGGIGFYGALGSSETIYFDYVTFYYRWLIGQELENLKTDIKQSEHFSAVNGELHNRGFAEVMSEANGKRIMVRNKDYRDGIEIPYSHGNNADNVGFALGYKQKGNLWINTVSQKRGDPILIQECNDNTLAKSDTTVYSSEWFNHGGN